MILGPIVTGILLSTALPPPASFFRGTHHEVWSAQRRLASRHVYEELARPRWLESRRQFSNIGSERVRYCHRRRYEIRGIPVPTDHRTLLPRPGKIKVGPRRAVEQHANWTNRRGLVVVGRAFNNLSREHFLGPVRRLGFETVFDYRYDQLGQNGYDPDHEDVVLVDGTLYVNRMSEEIRQVSLWHAVATRRAEGAQNAERQSTRRRGKIATKQAQSSRTPKEIRVNPLTRQPYTLAERDAIMKQREPYAMIRHGRPDKDRYQRFKFPDPRNYIAFDPATGGISTDVPKREPLSPSGTTPYWSGTCSGTRGNLPSGRSRAVSVTRSNRAIRY
ncbi:hypothetical protein MUN77_15660 [Leucobacter allii]|uniref:hypothetical protein n=1 Tax=Leucobacter allii TaxID=2932247 RepID=UPI001FD07416|nr:hypothetical protein [Leucobacter allii]UOR01542.1 hypothetical protein MUN77_15660 [Leucobacter allii]